MISRLKKIYEDSIILLYFGGMLGVISLFVIPVFLFDFDMPNNGIYAGQVVGIRQSGIFYKTQTVYVKNSMNTSETHKFCVQDNTVLNDLLSSMNKEVTIFYSRGVMLSKLSCSEYSSVVNGVTLR